MKHAVLVIALLAALGPVSAAAKEPIGSARVFFSPVPKGIKAGQPWNVRFRFYFHDGKPWRISGLYPAVTIRNNATGTTRVFRAFERSSTWYAARVVFPSAGAWTVTFRFDTRTRMGTRRLVVVRVR